MMYCKPQEKVVIILKSVNGENESLDKGTFYFSILKSIAVHFFARFVRQEGGLQYIKMQGK